MRLFMGTVLMGTVLFLFETLTAGTFSSRGARTLSDEHVGGRGHRVAGWYQNVSSLLPNRWRR